MNTDTPHRQAGQKPTGDVSIAIVRRRGLVAGAIAAAAAIALDRGDPAAAADPNDVVLGAVNTTNKTTTITNIDPTSATALVLNCIQARSGTGVQGHGTNYGVRGTGHRGGGSSPIGVYGDSDEVGVRGESRATTGAGWGVFGTSGSRAGSGVRGECPGVGVYGATDFFDDNPPSGPIGVFGTSSALDGLGGVFTGRRAPLRLLPATTPGSPTGGRHDVGEIMVDSTGRVFACTEAGTPGTWTELGAPPPPAPAPPAPQPALTLLATPERFVDTRTALGGVQGPVPGSTTRTYTMTGRLGQSGNPPCRSPTTPPPSSATSPSSAPRTCPSERSSPCGRAAPNRPCRTSTSGRATSPAQSPTASSSDSPTPPAPPAAATAD